MTRFARAQGSKVRFYGHFLCWLEDKYHKARTNVLPPVAFVYNEVPNCRITVDTLTLSYGLIFLLISLWWSLYFAETFVILCPLATFYSRSSSTVSSTQEPVLRSRHFFGCTGSGRPSSRSRLRLQAKKRRLRLLTLENFISAQKFFF